MVTKYVMDIEAEEQRTRERTAPAGAPVPVQPPPRSMPAQPAASPYSPVTVVKERLESVTTHEEFEKLISELRAKGYDVEVEGRWRDGHLTAYFVVGDPHTGEYVTGALAFRGASSVLDRAMETGKVEFNQPLPPGTRVDWQRLEYACKPTFIAVPDTSAPEAQARAEIEKKARELGISTDTSTQVLQFNVAHALLERAGAKADYSTLVEISKLPSYEFLHVMKESTVKATVGEKTIEKPLWEAPALQKEVEEELARLSRQYTVTVATGKGTYVVELEAESAERAEKLAASIVEEQEFFAKRMALVEQTEKWGPGEWFVYGAATQLRWSPSITGAVTRHFTPPELLSPRGAEVFPKDPVAKASAAAGAVVGGYVGAIAPFVESMVIGKAIEKVAAPAVHRAAELHRTAAQQLEAAREAGKLGAEIKWRLARDLTKPFDIMEKAGAKLAGEQYVARRVEEVRVTGKPAGEGLEKIKMKVRTFEQPISKKDYEMLREITERGEFLGYVGLGEMKSKAAAGVQPSHVLKKGSMLDIRWGDWQRVFEKTGTLYKPLGGTGFEGKWTLIMRNPEIVYRTTQTPHILGGTAKAVAVQLPEKQATDPKVEEINKYIKMITEAKQKEKIEAVQKAIFYTRVRQSMKAPAAGGSFGHYGRAAFVKSIPKVQTATTAALKVEPVAAQKSALVSTPVAVAVPAMVQVTEAALAQKAVTLQTVKATTLQTAVEEAATQQPQLKYVDVGTKKVEKIVPPVAIPPTPITQTPIIDVKTVKEERAAPVPTYHTVQGQPAKKHTVNIPVPIPISSLSPAPKRIITTFDGCCPPQLPNIPFSSPPSAVLPPARAFYAAGKYWRVEWFGVPKMPKIRMPRVRI